MQEKILCAAIHFDDGIDYTHQPLKPGFVICGLRHGAIFEIAYACGISKEFERTQGFLTSRGRFVKREEACKIAGKMNQINNKIGPDGILFSEDLY